MRNRCILVVDNNDFIRAFIRRVLQNEQFAVIDFADPEAALEALPAFSEEICAVVTDCAMPLRENFEFASRLTRRFPHLPILMIGRPFGPRTLIRALRSLIRAGNQLMPAAIPSMS